jgi:hypothetical protein
MAIIILLLSQKTDEFALIYIPLDQLLTNRFGDFLMKAQEKPHT